jgi:hypothetical protein
MRFLRLAFLLILLVLLGAVSYFGYNWYSELQIKDQIIERLSAESRIAEVLVTESRLNETTGTVMTTIKFLEYDSLGTAMEPQYFTFSGNIIQFQSLVVRFKDDLIQKGSKLQGKSAYLFLKIFMLNGRETEEYSLTETNQIPDGYKLPNIQSDYEKNLWENFWSVALDPSKRDGYGIKNAQIEAPGSAFYPGIIYTLKIEHDGGIRIDSQPIPQILKGE